MSFKSCNWNTKKRKQIHDANQPSLFSFLKKTGENKNKKSKLDIEIINLEDETKVKITEDSCAHEKNKSSSSAQSTPHLWPSGVSNVNQMNESSSSKVDKCTSEEFHDANKIEDSCSSNLNSNILNSNDENPEIQKTPYYLNNFTFVLQKVLENVADRKLFDDEDELAITSFQNLTYGAKQLYVRLFQRKQRWHQYSKLNYPDISKSLLIFLQELECNGFIDNEDSIDDLSTVLELLSVSEVKALMKNCNIPANNLNKKAMIALLNQHSKQQKSILFGKMSDLRVVILKNDDDDELKWNQNCLLMMMMVNIGRASFPHYKITAETPIFDNRNELIRYAEAVNLENKLLVAIENKLWEKAISLYEQAFQELKQDIKSSPKEKKFLQRFCASYVFCRCIYLGVEVLQRLKDYGMAVDKLRWLIKQSTSNFNSRGRWYDRLVLNLDQHLKKSDQALSVIKEGLEDSDLREHHKLCLSIRANRIKNSVSFKKKNMNHLFEDLVLPEIPSLPSVFIIITLNITIQGKLLPKSLNGMKTVFIRMNDEHCDCNDDFEVCSVERVALDHYKESGYPEGLHREGSVFVTLYGLLFWDIIYNDDIPDVFRVPYQAYPLDLNSDCFYESRKTQIDKHVKWLEFATNKDIQDVIKNNWTKHQGEISLVKWDCFSDLDHLLPFIGCLDGAATSAICKKLAHDFRSFRSGVPDLTVWNPEEKTMKYWINIQVTIITFQMVEVKGPGDRLSPKQMVWINYLCASKIPAEVCYVEGVSSKKLKKMEEKDL
ncbi:Fanconi-associated nuclease 1 [Nymphon striatum]|nr:Fanconi-associated nuclease 1 [Nymphon striatum]